MMNCQPLRIPIPKDSKRFVSIILLLLTMLVPLSGAEEDLPASLELPRPKTADSGSGTLDLETWMTIDPEADSFQIKVRNHAERRQESRLVTMDLLWPLEHQKIKPRPDKIIKDMEKAIREALKPKGLAEIMREERSQQEQEAERTAMFAILFPQIAQANQHWLP